MCSPANLDGITLMESSLTEEGLEEIPIESDTDSDESESDNEVSSGTLSVCSSSRTLHPSLSPHSRACYSSPSTPLGYVKGLRSGKLSEDDERNHPLAFEKAFSFSVCNGDFDGESVRESSADSSSIHACSFRAEVQCPKIILQRRLSLERLLGLLYKDSRRRLNTDTDSMTDASHLSDSSQQIVGRVSEKDLWSMDEAALAKLIECIEGDIRYESHKLVRTVKQRAHQMLRQETKCNIITAVLQAMSEKRRVDTKLQFSLDPPATESGYQEWLNAMKAVARLPDGVPCHFRRKLWTTLASHHVSLLGIDWEHTCRTAFNDKMNPDDDRLSLQIIKDLHRTGWSGLNGDEERIHLKRVLLGYARFNKTIGYCQGFNVIAALLLEVCDYKEELTLKIMIFLIEQVLPRGYFDQTLRALSVDMAVMRDLLHQRLPKTATHLDNLQKTSESEFEPPLTNVFSMQWLLTLFATCLPKSCVFRIWDALMLEGSEVLLRTALSIWAKLSKRILKTTTADEFYSLMGSLCKNVMQMRSIEINNFITIVYTMAEFPYPGIAELRERYTWNIQPLSATFMLFQKQVSSLLNVTDDDVCQESASCVSCSSENKGVTVQRPDLAALQKQYKLLKQRQKQAAVILQTAYQQGQRRLLANSKANGESSRGNAQADAVFNHLCINTNDRSFARPPIYVTMNGAVPVASTVVQPVNTDSQKAAGYRSNDFSHVPFEKRVSALSSASPRVGATALLKSADSRLSSSPAINRQTFGRSDLAEKKPRSQSILEDEDLFLKQFINDGKQDAYTRTSIGTMRVSHPQSPKRLVFNDESAASSTSSDPYTHDAIDKYSHLSTERKSSVAQDAEKCGPAPLQEVGERSKKQLANASCRKENGFGGAAELHSQIKSPTKLPGDTDKHADTHGREKLNDVLHSKNESVAT